MDKRDYPKIKLHLLIKLNWSFRVDLKEKQEKASEIIDSYAGVHAGTAFVAGQFGGQFGLDRVPLTAETISMINDLCDLYQITDKVARGVHIATALGRLTLRGTAIAQTLLNWIPFAGPAANSVTTYFLTKQAGWDCVKDIVEGHMNVADQSLKTLKVVATTSASTFTSELFSDLADSTTGELTEGMKKAIKNLAQHSDFIASHSSDIGDLLTDSSLQQGEKAFLSSFFNSVSNSAINGNKLDLKESLENAFFNAIATVTNTNDLMVIPKEFRSNIESICTNYDKAQTEEEKKKLLVELLGKIKTIESLSCNGSQGFIEKRVKKIVAEQLGVTEYIANNASFVDNLGSDSLDAVELIMALEEEFKCEIPDEDAENIKTVQDAIDYIKEHVNDD